MAQGTGRIFGADGKILFHIDDKKILDDQKSVIYSLRNNLIFIGDSYDNEDLIHLIKADDVFSRKIGYVYNEDQSRIYYTIKNGTIYLGNDRTESHEILGLEQVNENSILAISALEGDTVATIKGAGLQSNELVASMLAIINYYGINDSVRQKVDVRVYTPSQGQKVVIKPYLNAPMYFEWEWDGRILRPRWGSRPEDEWIFDGKYLRPYWGAGIREEWVWDGKMLKPSWQHMPQLEFIYEDGHIYPFWEYRHQDDWIIVPNRAKPKYSNDMRKEWITEGGSVPIPIFALIVLGIADR